jgi:hypothetical protein
MQPANMKTMTAKEIQRATIEQCRAESILDRRVPLGYPPPQQNRPQLGPAIGQYFRTKHDSGRFGKFWPLHITAVVRDD